MHSNRGNCEISNRIYDYGLVKRKCIENVVFENFVFADSTFAEIKISKCTFKNCKFIRCHYYDSPIHNNKFVDCYFEDVTLYNNLDVKGNFFERATGGIKYFWACKFNSNIFKDMDFTGFLPFYKTCDNEIVWSNNYFINTTVSLEGLKDFSKGVTAIKKERPSEKLPRHFYRDRGAINPNTLELVSCGVNHPYADILPDVVEINDEVPCTTIIDVSNASDVMRLNIIASVLTKFRFGHAIYEYSDSERTDKSFLEHYTVPNPRPIKIVDNRGYILNDGVIQDVNFVKRNLKDGFVCDVNELIKYPYTAENDILNSDNYSCKCKSLIKVR